MQGWGNLDRRRNIFVCYIDRLIYSASFTIKFHHTSPGLFSMRFYVTLLRICLLAHLSLCLVLSTTWWQATSRLEREADTGSRGARKLPARPETPQNGPAPTDRHGT